MGLSRRADSKILRDEEKLGKGEGRASQAPGETAKAMPFCPDPIVCLLRQWSLPHQTTVTSALTAHLRFHSLDYGPGVLTKIIAKLCPKVTTDITGVNISR